MAGIGIKVATSMASAGALGGGAYGIYTYNNTTDTVRNYLKKNNLTPRTTNWETVLEAYKLEKTSQTEIQTGAINNADVIKTWCEKNLSSSIQSVKDNLFKKASQWCVNFQSISEKLGEAQFETVASKLTSKYASLQGRIKDLIDGVTGAGSSNGNGDKIKSWCDSNKKRRFSSDGEFYSSSIKSLCLKG
ncbi:hypothetical protein A6V39_03945 [Candidatus Mycoplasma haematobovis]|uniref:Uncharacterized protein n=1 Tax=Candidatus Mycoplasma haematobovis TaxID=432608 RepID=A0A1A9QEC4_9MOLU|nr:hypothetical protein [Candidatus Mycoplasma haematobovis]OAL10040.1 hypothetical protein A6V39_03945 [Candidatus Mycoplasma haematobovis]